MCEIYDDGERADVYQVTTRKAAKPHRCDACYAVILPGERYAYASGVHDHRGFSERACLACQTTRKAFGDAHAYYTAYDRLAETLRECIAEGDPESLGWQKDLDALLARHEAASCARVITLAFVGLLGGVQRDDESLPWWPLPMETPS